MIRFPFTSLALIFLFLPSVGLSSSFTALSCQPNNGAAFLIYIGASKEEPIWKVSGVGVEPRASDDQITLTDLVSSTMLILSNSLDQPKFRGLVKGQAVEGSCTDATQELLAAVEFSHPSMSASLAQMEDRLRTTESRLRALEKSFQTRSRLLRESNRANKQLTNQRNTLRNSVSELQVGLSELKELEAQVDGKDERIKRLEYYLQTWKNKVSKANKQIVQLCETLELPGNKIMKEWPYELCWQVK